MVEPLAVAVGPLQSVGTRPFDGSANRNLPSLPNPWRRTRTPSAFLARRNVISAIPFTSWAFDGRVAELKGREPTYLSASTYDRASPSAPRPRSPSPRCPLSRSAASVGGEAPSGFASPVASTPRSSRVPWCQLATIATAGPSEGSASCIEHVSGDGIVAARYSKHCQWVRALIIDRWRGDSNAAKGRSWEDSRR